MHPIGRSPMTDLRTKSSTAVRGLDRFMASLMTAEGLTAESMREQVEADWQRQDECRMAQIREPGLVRFVETELEWPGVKPDDRLRVPKASPPTLDGRLDDACWQQAARRRGRRARHAVVSAGARPAATLRGRFACPPMPRRASRARPRRWTRPGRSTASRTAATPSTPATSRTPGGRSTWARRQAIGTDRRLQPARLRARASTTPTTCSSSPPTTSKRWTQRLRQPGQALRRRHQRQAAGGRFREAATGRQGPVEARFVRLRSAARRRSSSTSTKSRSTAPTIPTEEHRPAPPGPAEQPEHLVPRLEPGRRLC